MPKPYTFDQLQQHRSADSCWVVLYGRVYDVTAFLPSHPGGSKIILQLAGTDATEEYDPVHPPGTLEENLPESACLGEFDASTLPKQEPSEAGNASSSSNAVVSQPAQQQTPGYPPPQTLSECLNLHDIETLATSRMSKKAWGYYYSAADDLLSKRNNSNIYRRILLRPRIFKDCTLCDTSTVLLGNNLSVPFFVSPAAMARLGHTDGEAGIAAACARFGAMQVISNNASQTPEQIVAEARPGQQVFGWQMYVQNERRKSEEMLARMHKLQGKVRFVVLTLDAPVPGKREDDERASNVARALPVSSAKVAEKELQQKQGQGSGDEKAKEEPDGAGGVGKALFQGTAPDLTWKTTLPWLAQKTHLPLVLKGIQTHEDAYIASLYAPQIKAIILSNHGGRAMDTAPPAIHTLLEIRKFCPEVFERVEVWVDGGVSRGTDVVKALCLGAKAVGIGRAPLFGLGAGGTAGVERVLEILKAETETAMRLLGVERVEELGMQHVNARAVEGEIFDGVGADGLETMRRFVQSKL